MSLILSDTGALEILNCIFGEEDSPLSFEVVLFTSPGPINDGMQEPNFTLVLDGDAGYYQKSVPLSAMTAALSTGIPQAAWTDLIWTFSGPLTGGISIKGYAVIAVPTGTVYFSELLATPFTPANNGDKLTIALRFRLGNGTPA